jgi:VanZ family protein
MSPLLLELDKSVPASAMQRAWRWLLMPHRIVAAMLIGLCGLIVPMPDLPYYVSPVFHLAHLVLFALVAWILSARFAASPWLRTLSSSPRLGDFLTLVLGVVIGASAEVAQRWIPGRHPSVRDVGLDLIGLIAGLTFYYLSGARSPNKSYGDAIAADTTANDGPTDDTPLQAGAQRGTPGMLP